MVKGKLALHPSKAFEWFAQVLEIANTSRIRSITLNAESNDIPTVTVIFVLRDGDLQKLQSVPPDMVKLNVMETIRSGNLSKAAAEAIVAELEKKWEEWDTE